MLPGAFAFREHFFKVTIFDFKNYQFEAWTNYFCENANFLQKKWATKMGILST